ncbi:MAG: glycoside hydrolase family 25 protein [Firmicutes bacterium]|nr:glycoside hydrolase family 25 protein [Bacillota bacterium]
MEKKIVDISYHNSTIDFSKLKKAVDGVMIRAGYGWYNKDKKFLDNVRGCEEHGIPYGIYFYSYATTMKQAELEIEGFLSHIRGTKPVLPVVIDMEDADHYKKKNGNPSWKTLAKITKYQCKKLEEAGYYAMYYASTSWHDQLVKADPSLKEIDLWLAHWGISKPSRPCGMWQYTSDGHVSGISGRCDLNICYKDYPTIIKEAGLNGWKNTEKKPQNTEKEKEKKMGKTIITFALDGDLANAVALFNVLPTAYLTKGKPEGIERGDTVILVGGPKQDWADIHLAGDNRRETLKTCMDFALKNQG